MALYELAILGSPTQIQLSELQNSLKSAASHFQIDMLNDIRLVVNPTQFAPHIRSASVLVED